MKFSHVTVTVSRPVKVIAQVITGANKISENTWVDTTSSDQIVELVPGVPRLDLTNIKGLLAEGSGLDGYSGIHSLGAYISIREPEKEGEEKTYFDLVTLKKERNLF